MKISVFLSLFLPLGTDVAISKDFYNLYLPWKSH